MRDVRTDIGMDLSHLEILPDIEFGFTVVDNPSLIVSECSKWDALGEDLTGRRLSATSRHLTGNACRLRWSPHRSKFGGR